MKKSKTFNNCVDRKDLNKRVASMRVKFHNKIYLLKMVEKKDKCIEITTLNDVVIEIPVSKSYSDEQDYIMKQLLTKGFLDITKYYRR